MQIKIYVVKTELLKDSKNILNKNALELLNALREELISIFQGLSVHPTFKGYWIDSNKNSQPWINGHIANIETDINEIWEIITDKETFEANTKKLNQIVICIKSITKQKSQLVTLNKDVEAIYITESLI